MALDALKSDISAISNFRLSSDFSSQESEKRGKVVQVDIGAEFIAAQGGDPFPDGKVSPFPVGIGRSQVFVP